MWRNKPYLSLMQLLTIVGPATFHLLWEGPLVGWGGSSVVNTSVGGAGVGRRVPSTVVGDGIPSLCKPIVTWTLPCALLVHTSMFASTCILSMHASVSAGIHTSSVCASVITGTRTLSMHATVVTGRILCKSKFELGVCVTVASRQPVGMPGCWRFSSVSPSLKQGQLWTSTGNK